MSLKTKATLGTALTCAVLWVTLLPINYAHAQLKADFTPGKVSDCESLITKFIDNSTGAPVSWQWDLGNGFTSTAQNPSAAYTSPGVYKVMLTVKNAAGNTSTTTKSVTVWAKPQPDFTAGPATGCMPLDVTFTDRSDPVDGTITTYTWDFGDGTIGSGSNPVHTYNNALSPTVTLTVTNSKGCTASKRISKLIEVAPALNANFSISDKFLCTAPGVLTINNTTSGPGNLSYNWDFGDGTTSSDISPGQHSYNNKGSYNITLTVSNDKGCTATKTSEDINVANFKSDFLLPATVCENSVAMFGTINTPQADKVTWSVDKGTITPAGANPVYSPAGTGTVKVTMTAGYGKCEETVTKEFAVISAPQAAFVSDIKPICDAPVTVKLIDKSQGAVSWNWDFGNGQSSTQRDPAPAFNTRGTYTVKLTVNSSEGCVAAKAQTDYLNVANYTTDMEIPSLVCKDGLATFKAICSPQPNALVWTIDGYPQYDNSRELYRNFNVTGTHNISLKATYGTCTQTINKTFTVNALPTPDFEWDNTNICGPGPITFKNKSTDAVKWEWNFNYIYWQSPETVDATAKEPTYIFSQQNAYNVSLKAYSTAGCSARIVKQISLMPPAAYVERLGDDPWSQKAICLPAAVSFKATSPANIAKYKWTFDGGAGASTDPQPTFTFTTAGYHNIRLEFETDKGCKGEAWYTNLKVAQKPKADFESVTSTTICGNTKAVFKNTGTGGSNIWDIWKVDDIYASSSYYNLFEWQFSEKGKHTIQLIAGEYGCQDTMTKVDYVEVLPPFPKLIRYEYSCDERGKVTIFHASRYAEKTVWEFGDGYSTTLTTDHPSISHVYTKPGTYKLRLITTNGQCTTRDSLVGDITVQTKTFPKLSSPQAAICNGEPLTFTLKDVADTWNTGDVGTTYFYQWQYDDGSIGSAYVPWWYDRVTPVPFTNQLYNVDPTKKAIRAILKVYPEGCTDTTNYIPLVIRGSVAGYKVLNNDICFNTPIQIMDTSKTNTGGNIKSWQWDFGDGQSFNSTKGGLVTHQYANPGNYNVVLKITDDVGCVSTPLQTMQTVRINGPKAAFTPSSTVVPLNATVYFNNYTNDFGNYRATYQWNFGNGNTATGTNEQHTYTAPGKYTVTLTATDPVTGCSSMVTQEITVGAALAKFTISKTLIGQGNCLPLLANFTVNTVGTDSLSWDFGDGTTAGNIPYPKHIYEKPGKYIITLTAYGPFVTLRYKDSVIINAPQATFNAPAWEGCPGAAMNWTLAGSNTYGYTWDFGDGNIAAAQDGLTSHSYPDPGSYAPTLLLKDEYGCITTANVSNKVTIHPNPQLQVAPGSAAMCLGQPITLTASGANTYQWSPAIGLSDPGSDKVIASPTQTITYEVKGTDRNGCSNTKQYTLTVHQPFDIHLKPEEELCEGDKILLAVTGADKYQWINTTAGLDNPTSGNPTARPAGTTTYTVVGYDRFGCFTDTARILVTIHDNPIVNAGRDTAVQPGEWAQLKATASSNNIRWNWSPADYLSCVTCPSPVSTPQAEMKYTVTATNEFNCKASDDVVVKLLCDESRIRIPNAISPNGDNKNDHFVIMGIGMVKHMVIYNRWGNKVFDRSDFPGGDPAYCWDGTLNGIPQPTGTYVYYAEIKCPKGETFIRKGTVILIR